MSTPLDPAKVTMVSQYDGEKRYQYLLKEAVANDEIWILTDTDGCVMLNTEDEDCVPVWPNQEFAQAWATGEWADCKAQGITLDKWYNDWTSGLEDDELAIVIFPNQNEDGLVVYPDELDFELKRQGQKRK